MNKQEVVQSAGAKLDRLNATMKKVMILNAVAVGMLAVLTACASYAAVEYVRLKMAMSRAAAGMEKSFGERPKVKAPVMTKQGLRSPQ